MRKDGWIRRSLSRALLVLAIVLAAASAGADEEKAPQTEAESAAEEAVKRYARERLLQRARDTVDPARRSVGGLDVLKGSLLEKEKEKHISELDPETWAEVIRLLGPLDVPDAKGDGLIRQGAIFYRWMDGTRLERPTLYFRDPSKGQRGVEVDVAEAGKPPELKRVKRWLVEESEEVPPEVLLRFKLDVERDPDRGNEILAGGMDQLRAVKPPLADLALTRPDEFHFIVCRTYLDMRKRQVEARVAVFKADIPSAGLVSAGSVRTREERAERLREKVTRIVAMQLGVQGSLDRLAREESRLRRQSGSVGFEIEEARRAFHDFRKQRDEERAVAEKAAAEKAAAEKAAGEKEAEEKAGAEEPAGNAGEGVKDGDEDLPSDEPGSGDAPAGDAPAGDAPAGEASPEGAGPGLEEAVEPPEVEEAMDATEKNLERLRLKEILDAQRLRLLYIAVRRAALRGTLLAEILIQVKEEAVAAEDAHERYEIDLATVRRERQMDRLAFEQAGLKLELERAHKKASEGPEGERAVWGAYEGAVEALGLVNDATIAGVQMRRMLEIRTKPVDRDFVPGCLPGEEGQATEENDALKRFRDCRAAALDAAYVRDAMGALDSPGWDAKMTAVHYEAVDDRITDLESAREIIQQAHSLQERYDVAHEGAVTSLDVVEKLGAKTARWWDWRQRLLDARGEWLIPNEKAFRETMRAITDEFDQVAANIELYRTFRERLLHLGPRSFRVRIQRELDTERLGTAYGEAIEALRSAGRWLSFQGEEHLGTYVRRHWLMLLACVAGLLASLAAVKYGRRLLDAALKRMARSVKALRAEPVTVGAEDEQARRERELAEVAARAEEEAALREVSKGEAGKSQRMGEGGYSAESDA